MNIYKGKIVGFGIPVDLSCSAIIIFNIGDRDVSCLSAVRKFCLLT